MDQINALFSNLNNLQKSLFVVIAAVLVYIFSAATAYSFFATSTGRSLSNLTGTSLPTPASVAEEDPGAPRTEECPLDGVMHTVAAREAWEKRRPLAVMIENHIEARPQSGLSAAQIIYEAVAEGGITRFMALYYCNFGDVQIGPVRSARTYFLDWLSEYDALYAHVGGANCTPRSDGRIDPTVPGCQNGAPADALGQIIKYGMKALDQRGISYPTYWRDYQRLPNRITEHTMYSTIQKLWAIGEKRGWTVTDEDGVRWDKNFVPWKFKDDEGGGSVNNIKVSFWSNQGDYSVEWNYDSSCNCYKRKNAGTDHLDLNSNRQLSPKNIVVQFMTESRANDGYENNVHLLYKTQGKGKALIFMDGKAVEGEWVKASRLAREKFVGSDDKEIEFNRDQIWIQTVPEGAEVKY